MLGLTPNEFSYKMFTAPKTKITTEDLLSALRIYKYFWTKQDLKKAIKKVGGLTASLRTHLTAYPNPLTSRFSNIDDNCEYIILYTSTFNEKYLTPEEYQELYFSSYKIFTAIPTTIAKRAIPKPKAELFLSILKRYPKTTQSRILIRYLNKLLKEYPNEF